MSRWLSVLVFMIACARSSYACQCASPGGSCHTAVLGNAMFLGEVLSVHTAPIQELPASMHGFRQNVYRIHVVDAFSASLHSGEDVEVRTGLGGGDCGYGFAIGQRYFIDAYDSGASQPVHLSTGICSRTAPESEAVIDLKELRDLIAGNRPPDLDGQVLTSEGIGEAKPGEVHPLPNIKVTLTAKSDGSVSSRRTDETGVYTFATLVPGIYEVDFDLPSNRTYWAKTENKPLTVTVPNKNGIGANCHVNISAGPSGAISGQLVDAEGNGVPGFVAAYPDDGEKHYTWSAAGGTEADGRFKLDFLRDGAYRVEYSASRSNRDHAAHATVQQGQDTANVILRIPPASPLAEPQN